MSWFETAVAMVLGGLGARSAAHWFRRPLAGKDATDHLLFALFVLGRVGVWWSLAGLFAIYAAVSSHLKGMAFTDEIKSRFWWYPVIVMVFASMQFAAGFLLGRRSSV
ncbi:MAG: hypothetical protein M3P11_04115 [Actinomycetota bacterium]|nr:hypothetical protein [Actinomycetota bacterium]